MGGMLKVGVEVTFSDIVRGDQDARRRTIEIKADGSDSIYDMKSKIAEAFGGALKADNLQLYFGPNDRKIGRQFEGDPNVDERALTLAGFSILPWLRRFPEWRVGVKLIPAMPPAPGVAIKKAAALAEGKDPDKAVQEARAKGELLKLSQLPAPWGPKPYKAGKEVAAQYEPCRYPPSSVPGVTA